MRGVKLILFSKKKWFLYATTLLLLVTIFCVFHMSSNKTGFNNLFGFLSLYNHSVVQGCYWLHSASDQTPLEHEELVQRTCNKTYPDVMIIGAKKCGTSALRDFLSFHPQLATAKGEVHFFDKLYYLGIDWYLEQMPYSTQEQLTLEKTPKYFVHPLSPSAIRKHLAPKTKFIIILRDPVRRAISDFVHVYTSKALTRDDSSNLEKTILKHSDQENLKKTLSNEQKLVRANVKHLEKMYILPSRLKDTFEETVLIPNGSVNPQTSIIDTGIYIKHLRRWLAVFALEQFLILDGEEFIYNPLPALQKVEDFLNLQRYFTKEIFYFDLEKSFYCLAHPIRSCMKNAKGRPHPYVQRNVLETLHEFYKPYNVQLQELLQQNFTWGLR